MSRRRTFVIGAWLGAVALAALIAVDARYLTDLSAFLPEHPTPAQRLLIDQLRTGPGSRLLLVGLEGGDARARAGVSIGMARRLRADPEFSRVENGEELAAERDRAFLFEHRYLLSEAVTPEHFSVAGLRAALSDTVADLASPGGLALAPLAARDPTGEMLRIVDRLSRLRRPRTEDGVWVSADGARTLLVAETAAEGSDTDAAERAIAAIRAAFDAARRESPGSAALDLVMSGPGVFAVDSRARIEHAVVRLSIASSALVIAVLLAAYRSPAALLLGLLPVATGALAGVAAVARGFGAVHGITLGFGITLIGEAVDYSIYFFIQSMRGAPAAEPGAAPWERRLWPTLRLGMLTSVCGFSTLLAAGFPGLAQLGAYSISGLLAAAAVTRFVLPELVPRGFAVRDLGPAGALIERRLGAVRRAGSAALWTGALALACLALIVLFRARAGLWARELSSLSPIPVAAQKLYERLRGDLGAPDSLDLVVVTGDTQEAVLRGAERAAGALEPLIDRHVIGGFDSPSNYLPSLAVQAARRASLPPPDVLGPDLERAARGLALDAGRLTPFLSDVEAARRSSLLTERDLQGTSLAAGLHALMLRQSGRWSGLLPLYAPAGAAPRIDLARVGAALAAAGAGEARLVDLKRESDALYSAYLHEALRASLAGLLAIVVLLALALRSLTRAAHVLAPLALAVLVVAAALALCKVQLTLLHLVGMLLIVAVGSNYALFFDARQAGDGQSALTLASLCLANLCTVIAFGLLCLSQVPVLEALGTTVAPGAFLALLFAALLTPRAGPGAGVERHA